MLLDSFSSSCSTSWHWATVFQNISSKTAPATALAMKWGPHKYQQTHLSPLFEGDAAPSEAMIPLKSSRFSEPGRHRRTRDMWSNRTQDGRSCLFLPGVSLAKGSAKAHWLPVSISTHLVDTRWPRPSVEICLQIPSGAERMWVCFCVHPGTHVWSSAVRLAAPMIGW